MAKAFARGFDLLIVSKEIMKEDQSPWKHKMFIAPLLIIRNRNPLAPQSAWSKSI
jgi:hypothetical protein